jgi:hypothetical protein
LSFSLSLSIRSSLFPSIFLCYLSSLQFLAAGQANDVLPRILLNCAEQWQGKHPYVSQEPGNPADVTIVLLVSNNNNNRRKKKKTKVINLRKSGTGTLLILIIKS